MNVFRDPSVLVGVILLADQLSPDFITPRFMRRVERLARFRLDGNQFVEAGVEEELLLMDPSKLTRREEAMTAEYFEDYSRTLQHSPSISVNEWWGRILRRVVKPRGPLVVLSGEELRRRKLEGSGWECGKGEEGKMMEGAAP